MSDKRLMVQITLSANYDEMYKHLEASGLQIRPASRIYPPILHFEGPEETINEFKQKYSDDIERVMIEEPVDD